MVVYLAVLLSWPYYKLDAKSSTLTSGPEFKTKTVVSGLETTSKLNTQNIPLYKNHGLVMYICEAHKLRKCFVNFLRGEK